jgi:hypothetical protein
VLQRVVEDVSERLLVLVLGLDHVRPEALAEDVVLAPVTLVERARILSVEVAHPLGQIRERCLDEEVVVVAEQAARVKAPAVVAAHAPQDLQKDGAVPVVEEDRRVVVPFRPDVVEGAGLEVTKRPAHASTVGDDACNRCTGARSGARPSQTRHVPGT